MLPDSAFVTEYDNKFYKTMQSWMAKGFETFQRYIMQTTECDSNTETWITPHLSEAQKYINDDSSDSLELKMKKSCYFYNMNDAALIDELENNLSTILEWIQKKNINSFPFIKYLCQKIKQAEDDTGNSEDYEIESQDIINLFRFAFGFKMPGRMQRSILELIKNDSEENINKEWSPDWGDSVFPGCNSMKLWATFFYENSKETDSEMNRLSFYSLDKVLLNFLCFYNQNLIH